MTLAIQRAEKLYSTDFHAWTRQQAQLLRELDPLKNNLPAKLDLENIVEEIETLGRAELHAVERQIQNILVHLLKAISDPSAQPILDWQAKIMTFHTELNRIYTPSMRQHIRVELTWNLAKRLAEAELREDGRTLLAPIYCPFAIADFVADTFDWDRAVERTLAQQRARA